MPPAIRKLVVCGDFHLGSPRALMPPDFKTLEGNVVRQNAGQQWLWHHWREFQNWIAAQTGGEPYGLVLMGDLIEGVHHGSAEVVSAALEDHVSMACDVLGPMADEANKTYVILGTESHTRNMEHAIARAIGAEKAPEGNAWRDLMLTVNGSMVFFTHHAGTSGRVYLRASRLSIHLGNMQLERVRAGHQVPIGMVAGHCHIMDAYTDSRGFCLTTPSWQSLTRYGHKVVSTAVPHVGGACLHFEEAGGVPRIATFRRDWPQPAGVIL
jgi:hypothetical protein